VQSVIAEVTLGCQRLSAFPANRLARPRSTRTSHLVCSGKPRKP
jgi:hypothetical protein